MFKLVRPLKYSGWWVPRTGVEKHGSKLHSFKKVYGNVDIFVFQDKGLILWTHWLLAPLWHDSLTHLVPSPTLYSVSYPMSMKCSATLCLVSHQIDSRFI